jgi:hypothetical protein
LGACLAALAALRRGEHLGHHMGLLLLLLLLLLLQASYTTTST